MPFLPLLLGIMGITGLSACGQNSGQPILFSTPESGATQSQTPSLTPENAQLPRLPSSLQAPDSLLDFNASSDLPPPPSMAAPQNQRLKRWQEERKNWALMTPAEILGVTPAEEMLKPPERDAAGREKRPTQLQQFLDRESQLRSGDTNNWPNAARPDSLFDLSRFSPDRNVFDPASTRTADAAQRLKEYLYSQQNQNPNQNSSRSGSFWDAISLPPQSLPNKPDLEQIAAMGRFRQMLAPGADSTTEPGSGSSYFHAPKTTPALDPNITQPDFVPNPAGASFTPVVSGIGRPMGLNPLPGVVPTATDQAAAPAWTPRPAPWLSQGPQPYAFPQRKF